MKIELKNIKINEEFSEETLMFKADIFINGKKVGYAYNEGRGGCTSYRAYDIEHRPIIAEAEKYCMSLPPKVIEYEKDGKTLTIDSDLEGYIDNLVFEYQKKQEQNKLLKKQNKCILYEINSNEIGYISWKGFTIESILASGPKGIEAISKVVKRLQGEGKKILNTNLPETVLK